MKEYYTSDWHLGEDRIGNTTNKPNVFYRPFTTIEEQDNYIMDNLYATFKDGDTLWHLGDVVTGNMEDAEVHLKRMRDKYPNSKLNLILGNYDTQVDVLAKYFDNIDKDFKYFGFHEYTHIYINHYPIECLNQFCPDDPYNDIFSFGITGHIHGLWKVQPRLINVGVDAWHFKPVSKDEVIFCWEAMKNHYDENVFPPINTNSNSSFLF